MTVESDYESSLPCRKVLSGREIIKVLLEIYLSKKKISNLINLKATRDLEFIYVDYITKCDKVLQKMVSKLVRLISPISKLVDGRASYENLRVLHPPLWKYIQILHIKRS